MAGYDIVYVAVAPPDVLEANLVKKVGAIIDKDLYGTRLLLVGRIPRIIDHYQTIQTAESVAQSLRALGLVAIVCKDSELRKPSRIFRAYTLKLREGEVIFWDKGGEARRLKSKDASLILKGTIQTYTEKEAIRARIKFSLPATVLTGGIPIWRRIKEKIKNLSIQTEYFVRLYDRSSPELAVEIVQHNFDYSSLGTKMASSSFANLSTIITELRNTFPQAVSDDRLTEPFAVDVPFTAPGDAIEINCKLIYLYHQTVSALGPSA
jgi:hypothetical protein